MFSFSAKFPMDQDIYIELKKLKKETKKIPPITGGHFQSIKTV